MGGEEASGSYNYEGIYFPLLLFPDLETRPLKCKTSCCFCLALLTVVSCLSLAFFLTPLLQFLLVIFPLYLLHNIHTNLHDYKNKIVIRHLKSIMFQVLYILTVQIRIVIIQIITGRRKGGITQ